VADHRVHLVTVHGQPGDQEREAPEVGADRDHAFAFRKSALQVFQAFDRHVLLDPARMAHEHEKFDGGAGHGIEAFAGDAIDLPGRLLLAEGPGQALNGDAALLPGHLIADPADETGEGIQKRERHDGRAHIADADSDGAEKITQGPAEFFFCHDNKCL